MPHLRFVYDKSMAEGVRMSALVDEAVASDKNTNIDDANIIDEEDKQD
jgi:ribosome-binding factor A